MSQTVTEDMVVLAPACRFSADRSHGTVVVESTETQNFPLAIERLRSVDARNLAVGYAATQGMSDPRVNGNADAPYPVNAKGMPLDEVGNDENGQPLPPAHPDRQPAAYRIDVPVCKKLV
jgi:hypothetical protein